jgi:hypothetical protein
MLRTVAIRNADCDGRREHQVSGSWAARMLWAKIQPETTKSRRRSKNILGLSPKVLRVMQLSAGGQRLDGLVVLRLPVASRGPTSCLQSIWHTG